MLMCLGTVVQAAAQRRRRLPRRAPRPLRCPWRGAAYSGPSRTLDGDRSAAEGLQLRGRQQGKAAQHEGVEVDTRPRLQVVHQEPRRIRGLIHAQLHGRELVTYLHVGLVGKRCTSWVADSDARRAVNSTSAWWASGVPADVSARHRSAQPGIRPFRPSTCPSSSRKRQADSVRAADPRTPELRPAERMHDQRPFSGSARFRGSPVVREAPPTAHFAHPAARAARQLSVAVYGRLRTGSAYDPGHGAVSSWLA